MKPGRQLVTSCWPGEQFLELRERQASPPGLGSVLGSGPEALEGLCLLAVRGQFEQEKKSQTSEAHVAKNYQTASSFVVT